ncbi:hypothetical protein HK405_000374 [Cladochytrium tenue]|nr:hypothetical protein HK405_000374 [Cladochytrium tenue]
MSPTGEPAATSGPAHAGKERGGRGGGRARQSVILEGPKEIEVKNAFSLLNEAFDSDLLNCTDARVRRMKSDGGGDDDDDD